MIKAEENSLEKLGFSNLFCYGYKDKANCLLVTVSENMLDKKQIHFHRFDLNLHVISPC